MTSLQRGDNFGNWMNDRCGKLTGSRMASAMAYLKSKKEGGEKTDKAERKSLKIEILAERMTGDIVTKYTTAAMNWGTEQEIFAKRAYEIATGRLVREVGFVPHPTVENLGASPDGLVGSDGLIEIKCPTTSTHLQTILDGVVPTQHYPQMILQVACCTGREWVDFVSFDPRVDEPHQLFVRRFYPTKEQIAEVESEAIQFLAEVDVMFEVLSRMEMIE
jgi:hypothetical protein